MAQATEPSAFGSRLPMMAPFGWLSENFFLITQMGTIDGIDFTKRVMGSRSYSKSRRRFHDADAPPYHRRHLHPLRYAEFRNAGGVNTHVRDTTHKGRRAAAAAQQRNKRPSMILEVACPHCRNGSRQRAPVTQPLPPRFMQPPWLP